MGFYSAIINLGADGVSNPQIRQIRVINKFNFLCLGIALILVFINGLSGLWIQVIANLAGIFLINIPVFFFNKHRKYELSKWIFSSGLISLVLLVSLLVIQLSIQQAIPRLQGQKRSTLRRPTYYCASCHTPFGPNSKFRQ